MENCGSMLLPLVCVCDSNSLCVCADGGVDVDSSVAADFAMTSAGILPVPGI